MIVDVKIHLEARNQSSTYLVMIFGKKSNVRYIVIILVLFSCQSNENERGVNHNQDKRSSIHLVKTLSWEIDSPELIPNPRFAGVLAKNELIVVDTSLNTINHFDSTGTLLNTFGGQGSGPGEFHSITDVAIHPTGRIAIADLPNARLVIMDIYDETIHHEKLPPGWHPRLTWVGNEIVITFSPFTHDGDVVMKRYNPEDRSFQIFRTLELELQEPPPDQISCTFCSFVFLEDLSFYTSRGDTSYQITRVDHHSDEYRTLSRSGIPADRLTNEEREERRAQFQQFGMSEAPPLFRKRFRSFYLDHKHRLWALMRAAEEEKLRFDIFSDDGAYEGTLQAPPDAEAVLSLENDRILFQMRSDDPDSWKAILYQIEG